MLDAEACLTSVVGRLNLSDLLKQGGLMTNRNPILPPVDAYTASSLLQKAIRRGDAAFAIEAARVLVRLRGRMVWRRLTLIAFEDVGVADPKLCADVTMVAGDHEARSAAGGDLELAFELVRRLVIAPKNRESDYLICTAIQAPRTDRARARLSSWSGSLPELHEAIKEQLHDPKSFEHISSGIGEVLPDGRQKIDLKYRARNAFGAMRLGVVRGWFDNESCRLLTWEQTN